MNSWTAIEEALRRRGKTGSVVCTATVRRVDGGVWIYRLRDAMFRLKEDA